MSEAAISFDALDVLEHLLLSPKPLSLPNLGPSLPWVKSLPSSLRELIDRGLVRPISVQFALHSEQEAESIDFETTTLYVPVSNTSLKQAHSIDSSAVLPLLLSLESSITKHGTSCIPPDIVPASTRGSLATELQKLRSLRVEYVSQLKELNTMEESQKSEGKESSSLPPTNSSELSRLEDHKSNKDKVRADARELLQTLANRMAYHNNVTFLDVISDYKTLL